MPQTRIANGNITPARFITLDASVDGRVLQAGSGNLVIGISALDTRRSPYLANETRHAAAGEPCKFFDFSEECALELGNVTCTPGMRLKPDSNGAGVESLGNASYGAVALAGGVEGELIPVKVQIDN